MSKRFKSFSGSPSGPATVEREVDGGTINWFVRRERRGVPAGAVGLRQDCCTGFARVIYPDPDDFLGVAIGDSTLWRGPVGPDLRENRREPMRCSVSGLGT